MKRLNKVVKAIYEIFLLIGGFVWVMLMIYDFLDRIFAHTYMNYSLVERFLLLWIVVVGSSLVYVILSDTYKKIKRRIQKG